MKISKESTCTNERNVPSVAYRDWLTSPTSAKQRLESNTSVKWYKIKESTFENILSEFPNTNV